MRRPLDMFIEALITELRERDRHARGPNYLIMLEVVEAAQERFNKMEAADQEIDDNAFNDCYDNYGSGES